MTTVSSWIEFVDYVQRFVGDSPRLAKYLFRGQNEAEWKLEPSFSRLCHDKTIRWSLDREYHMQRLFRLDAHNHISQPILPSHTNQLELWWSVMQHYGVSTRLLDWTCSPFVAAYFAVSNLDKKDAAVWLVHPNSVNENAKSRYEFTGQKFIDAFVTEVDSNLVWFYEPAVKTDRMLSQQGWFSVCANPIKEHSQPIWEDCEEETLHKIVIPHQLKAEFLKQLNFMNITARTIYPGLDGLGASVQEYLKLEINKT
jgi:hypothetical protein